jgi:hypothetical protein
MVFKPYIIRLISTEDRKNDGIYSRRTTTSRCKGNPTGD